MGTKKRELPPLRNRVNQRMVTNRFLEIPRTITASSAIDIISGKLSPRMLSVELFILQHLEGIVSDKSK